MAGPAYVQAATLEKFLTAWKDGKADDTMALWSEDFRQRLLPLSLGTAPTSRAEARHIYPKLVGALTNWKLEVREIVHDASRGTAAVYATSQADTPLPGEKWSNEYAIFLSFSSDGTKITRLEEMVDSAFYRDFFPKMQSYMMQRGKEHP